MRSSLITSIRSRAATSLAGVLLVAALAGCAGQAGSGETSSAPSLPNDFPVAVELSGGDLISAAKNGAAWTASVTLGDSDTRQGAVEKLTDHGFVIIGENITTGNDQVYSLSGSEYSVRLGFSEHDGRDVVNYTVAPRADESR
ncbi:hypothetical protein [Lysinibacter cavernae]|uniref:hypothetical protein n=1 Tax=Lysinibacter cavernae TaxID=1640652 RepID=UPI00360BC0DE